MEGEHLAAVCGLYCGACSIYRAWRDDDQERVQAIYDLMSSRMKITLEDTHCDGCLGQGKLTPYCQQCDIRACAAEKPGVTRCSDCPDFPCSLINDFNNDGIRHHAEVLENIRHQREIGFDEWLQEEYERWRCVFCGVSLEWYAKKCYRCGTPQPHRLPSLPRDKK